MLTNDWMNGALVASGSGAVTHRESMRQAASVQHSTYGPGNAAIAPRAVVTCDFFGTRGNDAFLTAHKPWAVRPLDPPGAGEG